MEIIDSHPIHDFPNYSIYADGTVKNTKRNQWMTIGLNRNDRYKTVMLCKNNKHYIFYIHRLIGLHFICNPGMNKCIDHIDRDKYNNNINNLRWVTHQQNMNNKKIYKNNKLGYKNIFIRSTTKNKKYLFKIVRNKEKHVKVCNSLNEAIAYKKNYCIENDIEYV